MPYQLRSRSAPGTPSTEPKASIPKRRRIILHLQPRDAPVPEAVLPPSLADPAPLEPLFLGIDPEMCSFSGDDDEVGSSTSPIVPALVPAGLGPSGQDYSPTSPPQDLYNVDSRRPPVDLSTPECQAAWEAELARSPTPPPTTNKVIDAVLASSRPGMPIFRPEVQPLTPPRWVGRCTPPPPLPDQHLPTNGEIASWSERFVVADLVAQIADMYFLWDWDVPTRSLPECRLHCLAMLCLMEGCMPWPSWQCCWCFNLGVP